VVVVDGIGDGRAVVVVGVVMVVCSWHCVGGGVVIIVLWWLVCRASAHTDSTCNNAY